MPVALLVTVLAALLANQRTPAQSACAGDTNGDGMVLVPELIQCVNALLGTSSSLPSACDSNGDGEVKVEDLIRAVNNALGSCVAPEPPLPPQADIIEGASRVAAQLPGALEIIDIGAAGVPGGASGSAAQLPAGPCDTDGVALDCSGGGRRTASCRSTGSTSVLTEDFDACVTTSPNGGRSVLDGRRVRTIGSPTVCDACVIPSEASETITLTDFAAELECAGDCPPALRDARLSTPSATAVRRPLSGGTETTLFGSLRLENRATNELLDQQFAPAGLRVLAEPLGAGATAVRLSGGVALPDCLGNLKFTTFDAQPMVVRRDGKCPSDGLLSVALPEQLDGGAGGAAGTAEDDAIVCAGQGGAPDTGFRDQAFRALNGIVYQVLQNAGGDSQTGAEDFLVTTAAGSETALFPCQFQSVAADPPQAVAALARAPFDPSDVVTSGLILDAGVPCFDPRGNEGDGALCIGPGCSATCSCPNPARCRTFSLGDGTPIASGASGVPAAQRIAGAGLPEPCGGGGALATYGFGPGTPATTLAQCAAEPEDGVLLAASPSQFSGGTRGSTVVLAHPVPFGRDYFSGAGVFSIDRDGRNRRNCPADSVIVPVLASCNLIVAPQVRFRPTSVQFNFNADQIVDDEAASCEDPALLRCTAAPLATPTPNRGCRAVDIGSSTQRVGTTVQNNASGASCGGGGNAAPDIVFSFKAPEAGFYVFDTAGSSFDTVLSIRAEAGGGCGGAERACNDDRDAGTRTSEVGALLGGGEVAVVIVDGFGSQGGPFTLNIRRAGSTAPTPTPTPTVLPGGSAPDLLITSVTTQDAVGQFLEASAITSNAGGAADVFDLEFYLSTDAVITAGDTATGFGCIFGGLAAGATAECSGAIRIPDGLPNGTYFVGAIADPRGQLLESDEGNNAAASGTTIRIGAVASPTSTPSVATPSSTPSVSVTITPPVETPTATVTPTQTSATTPSAPTSTQTATATATATNTTAVSPTLSTPVATPTRTRTGTRTTTFTATRTQTATPTGPMNVVFAKPVGVSIRAVPSAGQLFLAFGATQEISVSLLSTVAQGATPVTVTTIGPLVAEVIGAVVVPAGSRSATFSVHGLSEGSTAIRLRAADDVRDLTVVVGVPPDGGAPAVVAPPVGASIRSVPSAGSAFLVPSTDQTVVVTLLSTPAASQTTVVAISSDAAVASIVGAVIIPAGSRTASLTLRATAIGTATVRLRAGEEIRDLAVTVGPPSAGDNPAIASPPVGASVRAVPSAGQVYLGAGQQRTVTIALLTTPAAAPLSVAVSTTNAAIATVNPPVAIAAGSRTASLTIATGTAGTASLRLRAADAVRDLEVIVGMPAGADAPAVTAPVVGIQKQ